MDKERKNVSVPVGAVSLLVIFAVLCLTVFALLSLSTARTGQRLSESSARAVAGYYEADCQAEETLARLRAGEVPQGVEEDNGIYRYRCSISDTQALVVEVQIDGADYTILRWQAVSITDWQADDSLPVWDGE